MRPAGLHAARAPARITGKRGTTSMAASVAVLVQQIDNYARTLDESHPAAAKALSELLDRVDDQETQSQAQRQAKLAVRTSPATSISRRC